MARCLPSLLAALLCAAMIPASTLPATAQRSALGLEDAPEPLVPRHPATEADRDRVEAVALFAAGRAHERRQQYADALRCYERAFRCDPQSSTIVRAAMTAAYQLKRIPEAVRYAAKAAHLPGPDPLLLRGLGADLAQQGEWAQAIALYEKALAGRGPAKESANDILLRMEMARLYCILEKFKPAADQFARVLYAIDHRDEFALDESLVRVLLGQKPASTFQLIGECFLWAERPTEAIELFEKAEKLAHDEPLRQFNMARVYVKTGRPAEALAAIELALAGRLADQGMAPYETLADALAALGRKGDLLRRLEELRKADSANDALGYYLAAQYRAANELPKAESLYFELLKQKPAVVGYRSLVEMYRQSKRFDALLAVFGEALEKMSTLEILAAEAQSISGDKQAMGELLSAARRGMKSDPAKFTYGMRLATAMLSLEAKQYDAAGEFFDLALAAGGVAAPERRSASSRKPSRAAEVLMVWGVGLLSGGRAQEAAVVFQRGIDRKVLPDDNPVFHFYLAGALAMAERYDEALAAARTAVAKKGSPRYHARPAWVLYMAKRYDEATKAYRELIEKFDADRESTETRDVLRETRLALSNIAVVQANMSDAEEWLEQVLDEFPDDEGALNDLGYLWADQNKHLERARRMIEKAVAAEPENMAFRDSLGWVLFRLGKYPEAVVELQKAAAQEKPDAVVLDHLGDAYLKANDRGKAVATWRKAAEAFRRDKEAGKAAAVDEKIEKSEVRSQRSEVRNQT